MISPVKSSLSKFRRKVSYIFFVDLFNQLIGPFQKHRKTLKGRKIYAIDGKNVYIPRTEELIKKGFMAKILSNHRESYLLRMHLTHAYDILSGVTKAIVAGPIKNEIADAIKMIKKFEKNSITLYDRLYLCRKIIRAHLKKRNYFIMRAKKKSTLKEIIMFAASKRRYKSFNFEGVTLYMVKSTSTKTGQDRIFVTNLIDYAKSAKKIDLLYRERWDVESSFKELTESLVLEQWHTDTYNGILQELYARFWLFNFTKIQIFFREKKQIRIMGKIYFRANFKLCVEWIVNNFYKILKKKRAVFKPLERLIKISTEKRKRYSRSYPRQIKRPASPYVYNNVINSWDS